MIRRRPHKWKPNAVERSRLMNFEGYGPDDPEIIFVGLEEYCDPDPEKQRDSIWLRCTHPAFSAARVDKNVARRTLDGLVKTNIDKVPVWEVMSLIVAGLTGCQWESEGESEGEALGTRPPIGKKSTWLTELRPLPRPGSGPWRETYIKEWFQDEFRSKADFITKSEEISGPRILYSLDKRPAPQFIFFYGLPACDWAKAHIGPKLASAFESVSEHVFVGKTEGGTTVTLTGFYSGQHAKTSFRQEHVSSLLQRLGAGR